MPSSQLGSDPMTCHSHQMHKTSPSNRDTATFRHRHTKTVPQRRTFDIRHHRRQDGAARDKTTRLLVGVCALGSYQLP